jgi:hypothetical protein
VRKAPAATINSPCHCIQPTFQNFISKQGSKNKLRTNARIGYNVSSSFLAWDCILLGSEDVVVVSEGTTSQSKRIGKTAVAVVGSEDIFRLSALAYCCDQCRASAFSTEKWSASFRGELLLLWA